jgi:hypothetical protein
MLRLIHPLGNIAEPVAANLDLVLSGFDVEGQKGTFVKDFDPATRVWRIILVHVEPDDFGATQSVRHSPEAGLPDP